jgi:hypothetical protein
MSTVRPLTTALSISILTLTLQGCWSIPVNLRSDPTGATVLANGSVVGATPMQIHADRLFPHKRKGIGWVREGRLTLQRPGCTPKTLEVDNDLLKRSLTVDLECRPDALVRVRPEPSPVPAVGATAEPTRARARTTEGAAERLMELEGLRTQGLITAEEYRAIRQRILDRL